jgi:RNA-directed DNA polymerase
LEAAEKEYHQKYQNKARFPLKANLTFKQVLKGKIEFLGMVRGKNDSLYRKLIKEFKSLSNLV